MGLLQHLEELRSRILRALVALVVAFVPCWIFVGRIYAFLKAPVDKAIAQSGAEATLAYLSVTDPFLLQFKVAALGALFLASPYVLYQVWGFVAPGLYRREKLYAVPFILFGSLFFLGGGVFGYYVAFPNAVNFLLEMGKQLVGAKGVIDVNRYFSFLMTVIIGLGIMFELPIFILVLSGLGVVTPGFLMRHFRWAVIIIVAVAAIITPTSDIVNLLIFAVPGILLYLLGVGAAAVITFRRKRRTEEEDEAAVEPA